MSGSYPPAGGRWFDPTLRNLGKASVTKAFFMYIVYVLYSVAYDKIYIGYTSNLENRFKSHNELGTKGWSIRFRPWSILLTENFDLKSSAMKREKQLKSATGRAFIKEMVRKKYYSNKS
jgi:putative endonuclease